MSTNPRPNLACGATALNIATQQGQDGIVAALLGAGADVDKARNGCTPLSVAVHNGHPAAVAALTIASGGSQTHVRRVDGSTPHSMALQKGHEEVVRPILIADMET
jgi:ankyrin repeat protein